MHQSRGLRLLPGSQHHLYIFNRSNLSYTSYFSSKSIFNPRQVYILCRTIKAIPLFQKKSIFFPPIRDFFFLCYFFLGPYFYHHTYTHQGHSIKQYTPVQGQTQDFIFEDWGGVNSFALDLPKGKGEEKLGKGGKSEVKITVVKEVQGSKNRDSPLLFKKGWARAPAPAYVCMFALVLVMFKQKVVRT